MHLPDPLPAKSSFPARRDRTLRQAGALLLLLYLVAGIIYSLSLPPTERFSDAEEYLKLSYNLIHGPGYSMDGVNLTASRPPGYAFFLAFLRALGGDVYSIRIAQIILLGATVRLVYRLCSDGKMFAGSLVVTGLVVCYPILFYISTTIYPQTLAGFLFILALVLMLAKTKGVVMDLITGAVFGALILAVPPFLFTLGVVLATARLLDLIRVRQAVIITVAAAVIVCGWTARNAVYFDRFVPIASNSGLNFLVGNNGNGVVDGAAVVSMEPYYGTTDRLHYNEFQSDHYYWHVALTRIGQDPGGAFVHYLEKVLNFFNVINVYATQNYDEISPWKQILMGASYAFLLALLAWRFIDLRRFPFLPREKFFLAVYILSAFTSAIFLTRIRLRLPYDYLLIALVALHLSRRLEIWLSGAPPPEVGVRKAA